MQFVRKQRHGPRVITPRQLSAYERSCRAKREKLPLLAPLIAEAQLPAEEEMARRQAGDIVWEQSARCLLYTSPSPRDQRGSRMPSSA